MKVNKQSKIKVNKSGYKRSRFNWSHDVNTTFSWGEIQPTQCKMLIPGSKTTMKAQNLIRLAPMVAPTFGRVKYKTFNQFVAMAEVFPNFDAMMAQEPKSTAGGTKVPQSLPYCKLGTLCSWILHGCRCTLYLADATNAAVGNYATHYKYLNSNGAWTVGSGAWETNEQYAETELLNSEADPYGHSTYADNPSVGTRVCINFNKLLKTDGTNQTAYPFHDVVTGMKSALDWMPCRRDQAVELPSNLISDFQKEVTMESADHVFEGMFQHSGTNYYCAIAVEFSDFGKRLRKILQGCGYQIDFTSTENVSIVPLLAQFKAYFDVFGLTLYQGWETTNCAKLIKVIENGFLTDMTTYFEYSHNTPQDVSWTFILNELGNEWYSEDPDYIGAHIERLAVSPKADVTGFITVGGAGGMYTNANISQNGGDPDNDGVNELQEDIGAIDTTNTGLAYINRLQHSQVDAEMLKRMYKWTNRNSLLGREIAKLLRAQGLGKYVDECKSNYIGASDVLITISDVISQTDTYDPSTKTGTLLGEYGGRGLQYDSTNTLVFENDEYGYWVTLATIVPESGYTQGLDRTLTSLDKMNLYNPDFDAIGMELTPKHAVVSTSYIDGREDYVGGAGFGFIPRYSKFKVAQNLVNGDFNRHSKRSTYMPYTLDKQLNVNDFTPETEEYVVSGNFASNDVHIQKSVRTGALPVAGNVYRQPTKYAWLGNFNRIFYNVGERDDAQVTVTPSQVVGFSDYNDDNFMSHGIYDVQCYAPMKPIEDSYGLDEDEADHAGAEFVSKA